MPLTNLTWKLEGDNSMSGKPCAPEVGYGKSQGGQGYLRLKPYCFNPNSVGRNGSPGVAFIHSSHVIGVSEEVIHQIHQAWNSTKIVRKEWKGSLRVDHRRSETWGSPKAGNGHGDGAIILPARRDTTWVTPSEGEGWQVRTIQRGEITPDGGI